MSTTTPDLLTRIDVLTQTVATLQEVVLQLTRLQGARLSRTQVCERLGVCGKTLTTMVRARRFPEPCADGKWLLAEVVEWEQRSAR